VQADDGWIAVRYLPKGTRYGASRACTSDQDMVEFYDLSLADDTAGTGPPGFGPLGQYITRYNVATLLPDGGPESGLKLYLGVPAWSLNAATMTTVRAWLRHQHAQCPIRKITLTDHLEQHDPVTVPVEQVAENLRRGANTTSSTSSRQRSPRTTTRPHTTWPARWASRTR
jgi:hypothetical protein